MLVDFSTSVSGGDVCCFLGCGCHPVPKLLSGPRVEYMFHIHAAPCLPVL